MCEKSMKQSNFHKGREIMKQRTKYISSGAKIIQCPLSCQFEGICQSFEHSFV